MLVLTRVVAVVVVVTLRTVRVKLGISPPIRLDRGTRAG